MKTCRLCNEPKPLEEFHRASGTRDGHRGECKACFRTQAVERYRRDPEAAKARTRKWQQENREELQEYRRLRRLEPEVKARDRAGHLRRKYGITPAQYDEMLAAQDGVCAICGRQPRDDISLHVDHDHQTGAIRALLCFRCNNAIGDLGESWELANKLVNYLFDHDPEMVEMGKLVRQRFEVLRIASGS